MKEKRTLIETFLPVHEISAEAKKEKRGTAKSPTFEIHYWWTRKPLVAARATVLGALLPEDFNHIEFKRYLGLRDNQKKRAHNHDLSENELQKLEEEYLKFWGTDTPTILDPFGGGGSIPFEALRVGCNVISNDYNPVAYLIQRATIEYPVKYGEKLLLDVSNGLEWIFNTSREKLQKFYPKHNGKDVASYIYSWMVRCPECGFKNPLVGQWWLVRKKNKYNYLKPIVNGDTINFELKSGKDSPNSNMSRGKGRCLNCGSTIPQKHIQKEILANDEERLLSVVLLGKKGKEYDLPNEADFNALEMVKEYVNSEWDNLIREDLISIEEMPYDLRRLSTKSYLNHWHRLLNNRQKLLFATLIKLIREYSSILDQYEDKDYVEAVNIYITFILGKLIDYNCRSTSWLRSIEATGHTLASRGIPMMWDHSEVNPFVKTSGSMVNIKKAILRSLEYSLQKIPNKETEVEITNLSIIDSNFKSSIIVTDPPYFDDVPYAELSEFFYVLEKRALKKALKLPMNIPKGQDLSVGGKRKNELFEHLFEKSCQKMYDFLNEDGILVMYFAHSSIDAWEFVVNSLRKANFRITATWPVNTESSVSPISIGKASILSSIVIVARKRGEDKSGFIEEIKEDLEFHLKKRLNEFWNYGLRGADITVAAMGASLDILTQYSEIKSYTGDMTVKDVLELVEVYVVEYILEKFLKDSESLDSPTRFYIYCRLSQLDGMSFDTSNLISKSLHIDLKLLESSGIVTSISKGKNKGIKLLKFEERESIQVKNLIDAVHFSMLAYDKGGMREFESVLKDVPYTQGEIYNILESFKHLESGDSEKQIAMQILGKSEDKIPERGQSTLDDKLS